MATNKALQEAITELAPETDVTGLTNAQLTARLSELKAAKAGEDVDTQEAEATTEDAVEDVDTPDKAPEADAAWVKEVVPEVGPTREPGFYVAKGRSIITRRGSLDSGVKLDPDRDGISTDDFYRLSGTGHIEEQE